MEKLAQVSATNGHKSDETSVGPDSPSVSHLIQGFQSRIITVNGTDTTDFTTPGYVAESPVTQHRRTNSKRKISLRNTQKKGKMSTDDARYSIMQSLGIPFSGQENRGHAKSYGYFDTQTLFFDFANAATLKSTYDEGSSYGKKLTGASAAHRSGQNRRKQSKDVDSENGGKARVESMIDEGDDKENELVLRCPYFRNEIPEPEDTPQIDGTSSQKQPKDIAKLISIFNHRNRSLENLKNHSYDSSYPKSKRHLESSEQSIFLEEITEGSYFFGWDEPKINSKQIFDFEHIDRGALYYREYFHEKGKCIWLSFGYQTIAAQTFLYLILAYMDTYIQKF